MYISNPRKAFFSSTNVYLTMVDHLEYWCAADLHTYVVLRSLLAPALPKLQTYEELVQTLKKHYSPKPLVTAERFHFHRRAQNPSESVAEYYIVTTLTRFSQIFQFLHLPDSQLVAPPSQPGRDRLFKVRPLLDLVIPRFHGV